MLKERDKAKDIITIILNFLQKPFSSILIFVDQFISFIASKELSKDNEVISYARPSLIFGLWVVFVFIVCGGLWAGFAPLDSAAHATGIVISEVPKQLLQTYYPGKVQKYFVRQGDIVNENQILIEIENKTQKSKYVECMDLYLDLLALKDRLISQRDQLNKIHFSRILLNYKDVPKVNKMMEIQSNMFYAVLKSNLNINESIQKQIDHQLETKVMAQARINASEEKLKYIIDTITINQNLANKGFVSKIEMSRLLSEKTLCMSEVHRAKGEKICADIEIQRLEISRADANNKLLTDTLMNLNKVNTDLSDVQTKLTTAEEIFQSTLIRSPITGMVNYITKDSNIGNNSLVAEVTPMDENLVIEVKIPSNVIDTVKLGQVTKVNFMSFNSRTCPTFIGTLIALTPNVLQSTQQNSQGGKNLPPCYTGLIKMDQKGLDKFLKPRKLKLITGMGADVQIVTGERTLLRYLLDPILDQSFKAFTEK
jgi:HlyD family type I secretion membrane fusion protein